MKKGRNPKYTKNELILILNNNIDNIDGKITFVRLEEVTGIHRHIWMRNLKEEIENINNIPIQNSLDVEKYILPNIIAIVNEYYDLGKEKLIDHVSVFNKFLNCVIEKSINNDKANSELITCNDKIKELEYFIQKQKDMIRSLETTIKTIDYEKNVKDYINDEYCNKNEKIINIDFENSFPDIFK